MGMSVIKLLKWGRSQDLEKGGVADAVTKVVAKKD